MLTVLLASCYLFEPDSTSSTTTADGVDADEDGFPSERDCDDADAAVHPGVREVCNGVDDDCDGEIDDRDPSISDQRSWYADADGDGFGDPDARTTACEAPDGTVEDHQDCDDTAPAVHPGAQEVCGGADEDCDYLLDDEDSSVVNVPGWSADVDGDGYGAGPVVAHGCAGPPGAAPNALDCDDAQASRSPGLLDVCEDGIDQDCSGADRGCIALAGAVTVEAAATAIVVGGELGARFGGGAVVLDWNGDGADDLALAAEASDRNVVDGGAVWIYYGPLVGELAHDTAADVVISGSTVSGFAGAALRRVPDFDGDGDDELAFAAAASPDDEGLFLGGKFGGVAAIVREWPIRCADAVGLGDADGDGAPEWACAAGSITVREGPASGAAYTLTANSAADAFTALASGADLDGDGVDEWVAASATMASESEARAGLVFVFSPPHASAVGLDAGEAALRGIGFQELGASLALGDTNGDGYADLFAGSAADDAAETDAGAWFGWYGPVPEGETSITADVTVYGAAAGSALGGQAALVRDLDGDGAAELLFSDPGAEAAWLLNGPGLGTMALGDAEADGAYLAGVAAGDRFGSALALADDLTGDGGVDLVVAAEGAAGAAYVLPVD